MSKRVLTKYNNNLTKPFSENLLQVGNSNFKDLLDVFEFPQYYCANIAKLLFEFVAVTFYRQKYS